MKTFSHQFSSFKTLERKTLAQTQKWRIRLRWIDRQKKNKQTKKKPLHLSFRASVDIYLTFCDLYQLYQLEFGDILYDPAEI